MSYYPSAHSIQPSYVPSNSYGRGRRRHNGYGNYYSHMPMQGPPMMVGYNSFCLILSTQPSLAIRRRTTTHGWLYVISSYLFFLTPSSPLEHHGTGSNGWLYIIFSYLVLNTQCFSSQYTATWFIPWLVLLSYLILNTQLILHGTGRTGPHGWLNIHYHASLLALISSLGLCPRRLSSLQPLVLGKSSPSLLWTCSEKLHVRA